MVIMRVIGHIPRTMAILATELVFVAHRIDTTRCSAGFIKYYSHGCRLGDCCVNDESDEGIGRWKKRYIRKIPKERLDERRLRNQSHEYWKRSPGVSHSTYTNIPNDQMSEVVFFTEDMVIGDVPKVFLAEPLRRSINQSSSVSM